MDAPSLRLWVEQRRAGAERELAEERRAVPDPAAAIRAALTLIALAGRLRGWPVPEDPIARRQARQVAETWARLRRGLGPG